MAKVLGIWKPDKSFRSVPLSNKAALLQYNKKLKPEKRWTFKELEEAEANKIGPYDKDFVTPADALKKVDQLQKSNEDKDAEIASLKAQLAGNGGGGSSAADQKPALVKDLVAQIEAAATKDEVIALLGNDERKGVTDAAAKKIASFEQQ